MGGHAGPWANEVGMAGSSSGQPKRARHIDLSRVERF